MPRFAVIIPAAGSSSRFGGPINKLLETLGSQSVIARTVSAFLMRQDVAQIILPTNMIEELKKVLPHDPRIWFCAGGTTRAHSVLNGLKQVAADVEWVAVHDGARPLITQDVIDRTFLAAQQFGAAVPALPVALTIKEAIGPLPAMVIKTVAREKLWAMQTPQFTRRTDLLRAFETCPINFDQVTDDMQLIELSGAQVQLVQGDERNIKITTQLDLRLAQLMIEH